MSNNMSEDSIECRADAKGDKREDYISWDEYFMAVAVLSAHRSKDPNTQLGACIVNEEKQIVGIGYNGMPIGCSDDALPWCRTADNMLNTKYPYVCHAELNAILNKNSSNLKNCTLFVGLFPCNECTKLIIQSRIKRVVYLCDKYSHKPEYIASKRMLQMAKIDTIQFNTEKKQIVIDFNVLNK